MRKRGQDDNLILSAIWERLKAAYMIRKNQDELDTHRTMRVVNHIRMLIENGALKPGDKLPPEREFAQSLRISRASLRAGIGYLAAMGVMNVRHGVGTFVADGLPEFGKVSMSFMNALHGFPTWQICEARTILEGSVAALAAERGREEHYSALAEEVDGMFAAIDNPAEHLVHDVRFHSVISQAAGNPILAALVETVASSMYDKRRQTVEHSSDLRELALMHRELYRAIRGRDPVAARRLMEKHLSMAQTTLEMERKAAPAPKPLRTQRKMAIS
jgi:GntR family transcriptional repressor for pyruvate dehydrogenase complex